MGPPPSPPLPLPDLGHFADADKLVAALLSSGPLNNEEPAAAAAGRAPGISICADIVQGREPAVGVLVHEAQAGYLDDGGVLLVFRRGDGSKEVRMYSTGAADPVTGGCRLLFSRPI